MIAATILSWVLAVAPEPSTPIDVKAPDTVELELSDDSVQITARDVDGEVTAELFLWTDSDGNIRLDAAWPDGLYLSVITNRESVTVDSDNHQEAAARVGEIRSVLAQLDPQEGTAQCGGAIAMGIAHAVAASPWVIVEAVYAACECLPLIVDEWEGYHCPYFG